MTKESAAADPGAVAALVQRLEEAGTRRVKVAVCDIDGVLRGKYLSLDKFASVAEHGAGFCDVVFGWDSDDRLYDNVSFSSWKKGFPDASYRVDLATQRELPDEPGTPFFLVDLVPPAGEAFHPVCPRNLLARVLAGARDMGYGVHSAFEYEFFVFDETPRSAREKRYQGLEPFTPGMFGYSILRTSVHADLHQEFMDYCAQMGMELEGYHTETGPGVLEAALRVAPGIEGADRAVLFKTFCKVFFERKGLLPTFMAKWSPNYPGQSGHLHMSLVRGEAGPRAGAPSAPLAQSAFYEANGRAGMTAEMESFVAGQLKFMRELCVLAAPTVNSYRRLVKGAWAPTAATWAVDNRTSALRVIPGSPKSQRCEYRLAAADGNPYLTAAAALASGLEGIAQKLKLGPPIEGNAYDVQDALPEALQLPSNLLEAAGLFRKSDVARKWLGDAFVDHFANTRVWEWREFSRAVTDWELARYFEII